MWHSVKLCLFIALCCVPATNVYSPNATWSLESQEYLGKQKTNKQKHTRVFPLKNIKTEITKEANSN